MRGSRFIAVARPATTLEAAAAVREAERRRFHDATHHVFGTVLRTLETRWDDDGEPPGTAGRQVTAVIEGAGIRDVVVVVTRYFGGTKLGTGGLARAYAAASAESVSTLPVRQVVRGQRLRVAFPYEDMGVVSRALAAEGTTRLSEAFGERVELEVGVERESVEEFLLRLVEATAGRLECIGRYGDLLIPRDT